MSEKSELRSSYPAIPTVVFLDWSERNHSLMRHVVIKMAANGSETEMLEMSKPIEMGQLQRVRFEGVAGESLDDNEIEGPEDITSSF